MSTRGIGSPRLGFRSNFGAISRAALLIFLVIALAPLRFALGLGERESRETGIITLLPTGLTQDCPDSSGLALTISADDQGKPKCTANLKFDLKSVPVATVTSARLILAAKEDGPEAAQTISVNQLVRDGSPVPFGQKTFNPGAPQKGARAVWSANELFLARFPIFRGEMSLALTTSKGEGRIWHTHRSESSLQPRLVLEYSYASGPAVTQSDGLPAVHSPRAFLPKLADSSSNAFSYVTRPFPKAWSKTPAFYFGWVFILAENGDHKALLLDSLGKPLRPVPLPPSSKGASTLGQHLLVSKRGRLVIVGDGRTLVLPIDAESDPPMLDAPLQDRDEPALNPETPPAMGVDGSLYVVNGLEVYGLNPDFQVLWKVTLDDQKTSRPTVGPSGRFVYLTTRTRGLVAIDAQTGELFPVELPNQASVKSTTGDPTLHAPVVIRDHNGVELVYVAANSVNDGVLARFDNLKTAYGKEGSGTIALKEAWKPLKGLWGQPIVDRLPPEAQRSGSKSPNPDKKIYAVRVKDRKGRLEAISCFDGSLKTPEDSLGFGVGEQPYLLNGGNLVMDGAGNCFVWNGMSDNKDDIGLYVYDATLSHRIRLLPKEESGASAKTNEAVRVNSGIPAEAQLFFGGDGSLCAYGIEDRILRAVVPHYTPDVGRGAGISSPVHILVDGKVEKATTIRAGGSVILGPGFGVQKGATLSISTGHP